MFLTHPHLNCSTLGLLSYLPGPHPLSLHQISPPWGTRCVDEWDVSLSPTITPLPTYSKKFPLGLLWKFINTFHNGEYVWESRRERKWKWCKESGPGETWDDSSWKVAKGQLNSLRRGMIASKPGDQFLQEKGLETAVAGVALDRRKAGNGP